MARNRAFNLQSGVTLASKVTSSTLTGVELIKRYGAKNKANPQNKCETECPGEKPDRVSGCTDPKNEGDDDE